MKKTFTFIAIFLACILLAGCISIPFGDGEKLSIGLDGINIVADDSDTEEGDKEEPEPAIDQDDEKEESADNDQDLSQEVSGDDPTDEETKDPSACQENYTDLTEHMPADFPMPDCASRPSASVTADRIDSTYTVEGNWEDMYNFYKDFFESIGIKPDQYKKPESNYGELKVKEGEYDGSLQFSQYDDEIVETRVIQTFPKEEE